MGRNRGGGARGGGGGAGGQRGWNTIVKGGFSESMGRTVDISIHSIEKQTDKAVLVKTDVSWNSGPIHAKDVWVPKSTIVSIKQQKSRKDYAVLKMSHSMAYSISQKNAWKGNYMDFNGTF